MTKILKLVEMQIVLDQRINEKFDLDSFNTFNHRKLALIVEISELANEVRCFKCWSVKPASEKKIILEEFVDCVHFVLSLGITLDVDFNSLVFPNDINLDLTNQFLNITGKALSLTLQSNNEFYMLFNELIILANSLNLEIDEIFEAYIQKNLVNHERQDNNY